MRVGWNEDKYLQNFIRCIGKIVPSPRSIDEHDCATKDSLQMNHHGYCVINFVDSVGAVFVGKNVNCAGLELVQDDMEVTPPGKEYGQEK